IFFLTAPCIMLIFWFFVGTQCKNDRVRRLKNRLFTLGIILGIICLNYYSCSDLIRFRGNEGLAAPAAVTFGFAIEIIHTIFSLLFLALSKLAIQAGLYVSSQEPSINKPALWGSIVGLMPFLLFFNALDNRNSSRISNRSDTLTVIAQAVTPTVEMYKRWTTQPDSSKHYMYRLQHTKNHCLAEYTKETSRNGEPLCLWRRVYDKNKKLIAEDKYTVPMLKTVLPSIKNLRKRGGAEQIMRYSRKEISQKELVEWAHYVLLDGSVSESSASNIMYAVGRIGLADVPEFSLPENTIEDLIGRLSLTAQ
ncbi:MAG: hypothetical protein ACIWVG_12250, partial [Gloeotrichia echinulata HAB0833]